MRKNRSLINWFLSPELTNTNLSQHSIRKLCDLVLFNLEKRKNIKLKSSIKINKFDVNRIVDKNLFNAIQKLIKKINIWEHNKYFKHFLIHGSISSNDYIVGWSDLDTWVVIDDEKIKSKDDLYKLFVFFKDINKILFKIDEFAHHGYITLLNSDLSYYGNDIMPIEVLKESKIIYGENVINYNLIDTVQIEKKRLLSIKELFINFNKTKLFESHSYKGKYLSAYDLDNNYGMYQLKYIISLIASIPSLYLSYLKKPIYKKKSFIEFENKFGTIEIINNVSKIRSRWNYDDNLKSKNNKIPNWVLNKLGKNWVNQTIDLFNKLNI
tara:strand:+ start:12360 stop:13334 length:975 start_codon:yes stop_codon:yes gene_type:complete